MKYLHSAAKFSDGGYFRFTLFRLWDAVKPMLVTIGLNPSKAGAGPDSDDPTIRKTVGFGERLGFGSLTMLNVSAYIATDPDELIRAGHTGNPENNLHIVNTVRTPGCVVLAAWGTNVMRTRWLRAASDTVISLVRRHRPIYTLRRTKDGFPSHPLYLPYSCQLTLWHSQAVPRPVETGPDAWAVGHE